MTVSQHRQRGLGTFIEAVSAMIARIGHAVAPPILRIALALPFFRSGLTRWDGFLSISAGTQFLFEEQFKLHILGGEYPFPRPISPRLSWQPLKSACRSFFSPALQRDLRQPHCSS